MVRASTFSQIDSSGLRPDLKEHVTLVLYENPSKYRILNIESEDGDRAHVNLCVDTIDDLRRLDVLPEEQDLATEGVSA